MEFDVLSFISLDIKVISLVSAAVFAVVILHVYYSSYHFIKRVFGWRQWLTMPMSSQPSNYFYTDDRHLFFRMCYGVKVQVTSEIVDVLVLRWRLKSIRFSIFPHKEICPSHLTIKCHDVVLNQFIVQLFYNSLPPTGVAFCRIALWQLFPLIWGIIFHVSGDWLLCIKRLIM